MKKIIFGLLISASLVAFKSDQILKTSLKITVLNELGNIEEGAEVQLFATEDDYRDETNPVTEVMITDKKGQVRFKELEPKIYFVNAKKGDKNNVGAGVQTQKLEDGKINKVTIIIE